MKVFTPITYLVLGYTPPEMEEVKRRIFAKQTTPTVEPVKTFQVNGGRGK